jgi:hypothetical protein
MNDSQQPPQSALAIVLGIILLLPGLCSLLFVPYLGANVPVWLGVLWVSGLIVGALGIALIWYAGRRS